MPLILEAVTAPEAATEVGVIAPRLKVIYGVEVAFATIPLIPFAVATATDVTVPEPWVSVSPEAQSPAAATRTPLPLNLAHLDAAKPLTPSAVAAEIAEAAVVAEVAVAALPAMLTASVPESASDPPWRWLAWWAVGVRASAFRESASVTKRFDALGAPDVPPMAAFCSAVGELAPVVPAESVNHPVAGLQMHNAYLVPDTPLPVVQSGDASLTVTIRPWRRALHSRSCATLIALLVCADADAAANATKTAKRKGSVFMGIDFSVYQLAMDWPRENPPVVTPPGSSALTDFRGFAILALAKGLNVSQLRRPGMPR